MFWERFQQLCTQSNITPTKICEEIGYSNATATKWKKGSIPSGETLIKIADRFNCSIDFLVGRCVNPEINKTPVMEQELTNIIKIPLMPSKASAGTGAILSDDYSEEIEVDISVYPKADFAVQIAGDSMQPKYLDKDIVLVHKQPALLNNQIGIFMLNGEGYIKKYTVSADGSSVTLVSLNPKYRDILIDPSDNFRISGRVLYTL
jgi:repressor LexA